MGETPLAHLVNHIYNSYISSLTVLTPPTLVQYSLVSPPSPLQARETSGKTVNNFMAQAGISAWPIRCIFIVFHHNCHVNSSQNPLPHPRKGVLHKTKVAIETATRKMTYDNIR